MVGVANDVLCRCGVANSGHLELAKQLIDSLPSYPGQRSGAGIVYVGGGRYELGVYIGVRMLRHAGCALPIQIWHRGSAEPVGDLLRSLPGVTVVDAESHPLRKTWLTVDGWQLKMIAALHSGWQKILFSDADNYFVDSPQPLFAFDTPIVVFPNGVDSHIHWDSYGLKPAPPPGWNGGTWLIDLSKCWEAANLAHHFDMHSDFWYRTDLGVGGFGDQDQLRAAFHWTRTSARMLNTDRYWRKVILIQKWPDGRPLAVHRILGKPAPVGVFDVRFYYDGSLPMEKTVWEFAREWAESTGSVLAPFG